MIFPMNTMKKKKNKIHKKILLNHFIDLQREPKIKNRKFAKNLNKGMNIK